MLRAEGLTLHSGGSPLNFAAEAGQCTGLLGNDAAELLMIIEAVCGIRTPIAGRVVVGGADILTSQGARSQMSVCLARASHATTTIREHVSAVVAARGTTRVPVMEGIGRLGVDPRERLVTPAARAAAALLAALIPSSNVIVLHRPFDGIDAPVRDKAIEWIRSLSSSTAAILATGTEERDVRAISHNVIHVGAGR